MKKSKKQEILSRILVSSAVLVLGSPIITQAAVSLPAAAETVSSSVADEATLATSEALPEQQEVIEEEQIDTEETTASETEATENTENTEEQTDTEETSIVGSEAVKETESRTEESSETQETETSSTEEVKEKAAVADTAEIQNLEVMFTDETGTKTLQNGEELPLRANGKGSAVGAKISFSLDTTGYQPGDEIPIKREVLINGEVSTGVVGAGGAGSISSIDVVDPVSGQILGTLSALPGGDIIFKLTQSAIDAGEVNVSVLIPTILSAGSLPTTGTYQITVGDTTINLVSTGVGFDEVYMNANKSTDGSQQWVSNANTTRVLWGIRNDYSGHVAQQNTPGQYTDSTGGIITNISDNEITNVMIQNENYRVVSFWSNGELQSTRIISQKGSTSVLTTDYLSGTNNDVYADASHKLNETMTVQEAQDALAPGEWGSIKLSDGSWLWAYKTGDPSAGTTLDGESLVAALKAAGVPMTDEDVAKTISQTQFIASTNDYLSVTFADSTKNGTAINMMGNGSTTGSTVLPSASSEVPGRITVSYIDDTTGALLSLDTDKGTTGETSTYSTEEKIAEFISKGYKLVSDNYSTNPVLFGGLGSVQQFQVHLVHNTEAGESETKTVERTIHYIYENGSKAAEDEKETLTFTRTTAKDLVTGKLVYGNWTAKDKDTTFDEVISPTIDKYTPDKASVPEETGVTANRGNSEVTVTYYKDAEIITETKEVKQTIHYQYEDGKEAAPDNVDTVIFTRTVTIDPSGDKTYGEWQAKDDDTTFDAVVSPEIDNYTPDKIGVPEMVGLTPESKDSEVTVTYKANMVESIETKEVKQTIRYVYEDGTGAAPDNVDTVTFTRTVTTNEATGQKAYGEWQAKDNDTAFDEVASPEIEHYTADKTTVEEVSGLTPESKDSEVTVTYKANMVESIETKEVKQTIHYVYEDGTKAAPDNVDTVTFTRTVTANEATGEKTYGEWQAKDDDTTFDAITSPEIEHYTADKLAVEEVTGLTAESKDSEVTVTYKPKMETTTETKEVNLTVHYVFSDGSKAADDYVDTVTFTRNATKNLATNEIAYDEWAATGNDTTFDEVNSPAIAMYTPDKTSVEEVTSITANSNNIEVTVTYKQNPLASEETKEVKRVIHYVYEDGKEAAPDKVDTVTFTRTVVQDFENDKVTYGEWLPKDNDTTFDEVASPEIEHYTADKATVEEVTELKAESKDSEVTVTYKAKMVESTETKEVKQTIHYVYEDGKEAAADKVDTVTFTRTVTTNEATGEKTYGEWEAKDGDTTFDAVESAEIEGYTADLETVKERTGLTATDKDSEVTLTYTKKATEPSTGPSTEPSEIPEESDEPAAKTTKTTNEKKLPQTGEETSSSAIYGGVALITAALLGVFFKRTKRNAKK
ncbi:mucin-binding protein [Enterococcus casseliflavus]|uniref:mucin-binding protein n=1 Tax=Enterococcus casseliflavus TaxID=37734 RepID=UPI0022E3B1DE|nr:MucBP domain-containing protein [Enterococcus casseliflavus]